MIIAQLLCALILGIGWATGKYNEALTPVPPTSLASFVVEGFHDFHVIVLLSEQPDSIHSSTWPYYDTIEQSWKAGIPTETRTHLRKLKRNKLKFVTSIFVIIIFPAATKKVSSASEYLEFYRPYHWQALTIPAKFNYDLLLYINTKSARRWINPQYLQRKQCYIPFNFISVEFAIIAENRNKVLAIESISAIRLRCKGTDRFACMVSLDPNEVYAIANSFTYGTIMAVLAQRWKERYMMEVLVLDAGYEELDLHALDYATNLLRKNAYASLRRIRSHTTLLLKAAQIFHTVATLNVTLLWFKLDIRDICGRGYIRDEILTKSVSFIPVT